MLRVLLVACWAALSACTGEATPLPGPDGSQPGLDASIADAAVLRDAGSVDAAVVNDAGPVDAGASALDASTSPDADTAPHDAAPAPDTGALVWSGPIVITQGGTYTGNWESQTATVPAVEIRTTAPVVIEGANLRSRSDLIYSDGFAIHLTVRESRGAALNPKAKDVLIGRFLMVTKFASVAVSNCYLEGTGGIQVAHWAGSAAKGETVRILQNRARNIAGRRGDGSGGLTFVDDGEYRQFFQLVESDGLPDAEVGWNEVVNEVGASRVEDNVSIYKSSGTAAAPIRIHDNYIFGAFPLDPVHEPFSGGGIMAADVSGGFVVAQANQVIGTTNYGVACSAGHDVHLIGNRVVSSGLLPDGAHRLKQDGDVGLYIWNANKDGSWANNDGSSNTLGWRGGDLVRNDSYTPDAASFTTVHAMPEPVTLQTEAAELTRWQQKLGQNGVFVGPH